MTHSDDELKIYYIVRKDMIEDPERALMMVGPATFNMWSMARNAPDVLEYQASVSQPKIGLRVSADKMNKIIDACLASNLFIGIGHTGDGSVGLICLSPCRRKDLPPAVAKLQLFAEELPPQRLLSLSYGDSFNQLLTMRVLVRHDIDMPMGKLVAQVGHAVMGGIQAIYKDLRRGDMLEWLLDGGDFDVGFVNLLGLVSLTEKATSDDLVSLVITDEGRTVFNEPTMTTGLIGPVMADWK